MKTRKERLLDALDNTRKIDAGYRGQPKDTLTVAKSMTVAAMARQLKCTEDEVGRMLTPLIDAGVVVKVGFVLFTNESTYSAASARERARTENANRT